jgi:(5-formylfuran-3-yl)methyl phosphate synthase
MTGLLASVNSADEADMALAGGADLIDFKDPSQGALGALPPAVIAAALARIGGRRISSATTGDVPMQPLPLMAAVRRIAATGVDLVKVGIFAGGDRDACLDALGDEARRGTRLIAVLFADQSPDFGLVPRLKSLGFAGVMLDTARKSGGGLRKHLDDHALTEFVSAARAAQLLTGLAGSLGLADVAPLAALQPDYLGFRGALCAAGRTGALDPKRVLAVRSALDAASTASAAAGRQRAAHSLVADAPLNIRAASA